MLYKVYNKEYIILQMNKMFYILELVFTSMFLPETQVCIAQGISSSVRRAWGSFSAPQAGQG